MEPSITCNIHPVVLVAIIDSFERRNEDAVRVIGTLLGTNDGKGTIEITNSFAVPHNESEDEVALDIEFARTMFELHRKVSPNEVIVGWYATGQDMTAHSVLIHEYYSRETRNPVHLLVDTSLKAKSLTYRGFMSSPLGVPGAGATQGTLFVPVRMEMAAYPTERAGVDALQACKHSARRTAPLLTDMKHLGASTEQLQHMLDQVTEYVDAVMSGRLAADPTVGRSLAQLINAIPKLERHSFEEMVNSSARDLLMVTYLSTLIKTQLNINQRLSAL